MTLAPGTRLGAYEIAGLIGAGGMGEVYRARDSRLNRDVAIKVLPASVASDRERLLRFEREARTLASPMCGHFPALSPRFECPAAAASIRCGRAMGRRSSSRQTVRCWQRQSAAANRQANRGR